MRVFPFGLRVSRLRAPRLCVTLLPSVQRVRWPRNFTTQGSRRPAVPNKSEVNASMAATMQNSKPQHYLRDFYLRVHPDLFGAHDSNAQMQNEDSLGRLNSILDFIQAVRNDDDKALAQLPPDHLFEFYCRSMDPAITEGNKIELKFRLPTSNMSRDRVLDYLDFFLQQLILLAGVPVPADVQAVWLLKNEHKGSDSSRKNTRQRHKKKVGMIDGVDYSQFENGDANFHELYRRELAHRKPPPLPTDSEPNFLLVNAMQDSGLIWFSDELSDAERMQAVFRFSDTVVQYYEEMKCNEWIGTPVYFHRRKDFQSPTKGVFVVPCEFGVPELVKYFNSSVYMLPHLVGKEPPSPTPFPISGGWIDRDNLDNGDEDDGNPSSESERFQDADSGFADTVNETMHEFESADPFGNIIEPLSADFRAERKAAKKRRKEYRRRKKLGLSTVGYENPNNDLSFSFS